jgi:hypothetical protein
VVDVPQPRVFHHKGGGPCDHCGVMGEWCCFLGGGGGYRVPGGGGGGGFVGVGGGGGGRLEHYQINKSPKLKHQALCTSRYYVCLCICCLC